MTKKQIFKNVILLQNDELLAVDLNILFVYWIAMFLLASIFLLNIWQVTLTRLLIYACILGGISSVVYAGMLVHRKFYY